jgi:hypothetical protein
MQKNFHILPSSNITEIKKDLWRDMGEKLKYWQHELKKPLTIRTDDTPDSMKARAATIIQKYDQVDVDILLEKWCEKKNQVGQSFACSCVVLLILIIYLFTYILMT